MEIMLSRMRIRRGMVRLSEDPKVMMVLVITAMINEVGRFCCTMVGDSQKFSRIICCMQRWGQFTGCGRQAQCFMSSAIRVETDPVMEMSLWVAK